MRATFQDIQSAYHVFPSTISLKGFGWKLPNKKIGDPHLHWLQGAEDPPLNLCRLSFDLHPLHELRQSR